MLKSDLPFYIELYKAKGSCYIASNSSSISIPCDQCLVNKELDKCDCNVRDAYIIVSSILKIYLTPEELFDIYL